MKKYFKFAAPVAFLLGLVAFILLLATPAIHGKAWIFEGDIDGTTVIFGNDNAKLAPISLIAWILVLVSLLALLVAILGPVLKVKALEKYAGLLSFCGGLLLVVAGVLTFFAVPSFASANGDGKTDGLSLNAGWIIAGILSLLGGVAAVPAVMAKVKK